MPEGRGEDRRGQRAPRRTRRTTRRPGGSCRASRTGRVTGGRRGASNGTDSAKAATIADVRATSSGPNAPPPRSTSTSAPEPRNSTIAASVVRRADRHEIAAEDGLNAGASRSAYAADRIGKTASENEMPIRLTGTTW